MSRFGQFSFRHQLSRKDAVPLRSGSVALNRWLWRFGGNMRISTLFLVNPQVAPKTPLGRIEPRRGT